MIKKILKINRNKDFFFKKAIFHIISYQKNINNTTNKY